MSIERERKIRDLFLEALDLPEERREAWVRSRSNEDDIIEGVLALLTRESSDTRFLEPTPTLHSAAREAGFDVGAELGDYRIVEPIGRGGTGVVFLADQLSVDRRVALKVFPSRLFLAERDLKRLKREAHTIGKLEHAHIIAIHDVVRSGEHDFLVMQYVDGHDLGVEIRRQRILRGLSERQGEDLTIAGPEFGTDVYWTFTASLVAHVADALDHAHAAGIVHRDIKPQNLLLDQQGKVVVTDFGLARDASVDTVVTATSDRMGTLPYMSPEQVAAAGVQVDHRTDIYSLGVVLYELLTLRRPYEGTQDSVLESIPGGNAPRIHDLNRNAPEDLVVLCGKAMCVDREDRFESAGALRAELERYLAGQPITTRPLSPLAKVGRAAVRQKRAAALAIITMLATVTLLWFFDVGGMRGVARTAEIDLELHGASVENVRIDLAPVDVRTGQVGIPTPLELSDGSWVELPLGVHRMVVSADGELFAESDYILVEPGEETSTSLWLRDNASVIEGMVRIPGGRVVVPVSETDAEGNTAAALVSYELEPYYIDRYPVTNGEYEVYLRETDQPPLEYWAWERDEDWAQRPVIQVDYDDALKYAMWAGKRLPTLAEWLLAARGEEPRRFPWGDDERPEELSRFVLGQPEFFRVPDLMTLEGFHPVARWAVRSLRPVQAPSEAGGGPNGLGELIGLVNEWVSTAPSPEFGGVEGSLPLERLTVGMSAIRRAEDVSSAGFAQTLVHRRASPQFNKGFRCVRSEEARVSARP